MHGLRDLAIAHHPPAQYERCLVVDGRHVCRRCSVLYPIAFAVLGLSFAGLLWPTSLDRALLLSLPVPVALEFVAEHLGVLHYNARRQVAVTALAAPALGRGLARYLDSPTDSLLWTMVAIFAGVCALSATVAHVRSARRDERTRIRHEEAHPLLEGFATADDFRAYLALAEAATSRDR